MYICMSSKPRELPLPMHRNYLDIAHTYIYIVYRFKTFDTLLLKLRNILLIQDNRFGYSSEVPTLFVDNKRSLTMTCQNSTKVFGNVTQYRTPQGFKPHEGQIVVENNKLSHHLFQQVSLSCSMSQGLDQRYQIKSMTEYVLLAYKCYAPFILSIVSPQNKTFAY